ncbi:hypothetical protein HK101_000916, partial [Irineochytrium annulatum]
AMIKSFILAHPPQGRHSMAIVRLVASFSVPKFLTHSRILPATVTVSNLTALSSTVRSAVRVITPAAPLKTPMHTIPAEWVLSRSVSLKPRDEGQVVLYLHGGAHIFMSPRTHRGITSRISAATGAPVLALDYRLAPESTFPAAIEDAVAAYCALIGRPLNNSRSTVNLPRAMFANDDGSHWRPDQVLIAGDSSGGCLSLQLLLALRALNLPQPSGAALLSPFVDNDRNAPSWRRNWNTDFLSLDPAGVEWAMRCVASPCMLPTHSNTKGETPEVNAFFSPLHGDLSGIAPILIQAGEAECLTDDAVRLHSHALGAGVKSELQLYRDCFHVFHAIPTVSAGGEAFRRIGVFAAAAARRQAGEAVTCDSPTETVVAGGRRRRRWRSSDAGSDGSDESGSESSGTGTVTPSTCGGGVGTAVLVTVMGAEVAEEVIPAAVFAEWKNVPVFSRIG